MGPVLATENVANHRTGDAVPLRQHEHVGIFASVAIGSANLSNSLITQLRLVMACASRYKAVHIAVCVVFGWVVPTKITQPIIAADTVVVTGLESFGAWTDEHLKYEPRNTVSQPSTIFLQGGDCVSMRKVRLKNPPLGVEVSVSRSATPNTPIIADSIAGPVLDQREVDAILSWECGNCTLTWHDEPPVKVCHVEPGVALTRCVRLASFYLKQNTNGRTVA